ncbi:hypothetical protein Anas_03728 [Armadillidium nasatum]|uniref:Uncharacterized protein n=1 Tax=Armadillidium nasatum TaxID=96803 RepID=A0A5N5TMB6_9CRUS|nr:hypothetical protein Anas_03728 [Armadillidium nasatum]
MSPGTNDHKPQCPILLDGSFLCKEGKLFTEESSNNRHKERMSEREIVSGSFSMPKNVQTDNEYENKINLLKKNKTLTTKLKHWKLYSANEQPNPSVSDRSGVIRSDP